MTDHPTSLGDESVSELDALNALKPWEHCGMTIGDSYRMLVSLFRDIQESHSLLSVRGRVLGNRLPERIKLLCDRAELNEKARDSLRAVRSALAAIPEGDSVREIRPNQSVPSDYEIVRTMERFGGSFVRTLAELCNRADPQNLAKIKATWPEYWQEYAEMARLAAVQRDDET
jgi:hypothetical protein